MIKKYKEYIKESSINMDSHDNFYTLLLNLFNNKRNIYEKLKDKFNKSKFQLDEEDYSGLDGTIEIESMGHQNFKVTEQTDQIDFYLKYSVINERGNIREKVIYLINLKESGIKKLDYHIKEISNINKAFKNINK